MFNKEEDILTTSMLTVRVLPDSRCLVFQEKYVSFNFASISEHDVSSVQEMDEYTWISQKKFS